MKLRIDNHVRWLVALGAVFVPAVVMGALELPFTFKAGDPIKASEVNANFAALAARIDGLSPAPKSKVVGAITIPAVLDAMPITSFAQSVGTEWVPAGVQGKVRFSEITIEREAGTGTPTVSRDMCLGKSYASAKIELGMLTVDLEKVLVVGVATVGSGVSAREQIKLTFGTVVWTWQEANEPAITADWDIAKNLGSPGKARDFVLGYFPNGVEPDAAYEPVASYSHQIGCTTVTTGCKPLHTPLVVEKPVSAATPSALALAASGVPGSTVELASFTDATTVGSSVDLGDAIVTSVSIVTGDDGVLNESVSFGYVDITWSAGNVSQTFNVATNK
jgi:type VI protein secretion system component Hcp